MVLFDNMGNMVLSGYRITYMYVSMEVSECHYSFMMTVNVKVGNDQDMVQ